MARDHSRRMRFLRRRHERAFVEWAGGAALRLPPGGAGADPELLAPLDPLLERKTIALVGESNHWVHEKYAYRLLFVRYLRSRGFGWLGEELARSDGVHVNRFLRSGDESELDRVTAYGYRGAARTDRDDAPRGVLRDALARQPEAELRAEQRRFARALRAIGLGRFFGFDVDYEPGAGYELLAELLDRSPADALLDLRREIARRPGETLDQEIGRLRQAAERIERERTLVEAALGAPGARELGRTLRTTLRSHEYVRIAHAAPDHAALSPALALREELMLEHVEEARSDLPASGKLILMSHALHLAKDDLRIESRSAASGPGGGRVRALGSQLARRHPGEVLAVWMLEERGRDASPLTGSDRSVSSPERTLNRLLGRVGDAFVLPTACEDVRARAVLARPAAITMMYGTVVRAVPAEQADVICFVREVSPLRGEDPAR
jgi:erythromycin esterase-like protein